MWTWTKAAILSACALLALTNRAEDNTVTVLDGVPGNIGTFILSGTNNLLMVTNGGSTYLTRIAVQNTARSNAVIVTGPGSVLSNNLTFAQSGISNTLQFLNGGTLRGTLTTGGTNNLLLFENTSYSNMMMTLRGRSNQFIANHSDLRANVSLETLFSSLSVTSTPWIAPDFQVLESARSNVLTIGNGAALRGSNWRLQGVSNRVEISGPGSNWSYTNTALIAGFFGSETLPGSLFRVADGGTARAFGPLDLGFNTHRNTIEITGPNSSMMVGQTLNVSSASPSHHNSVIVSDGARLITTDVRLADNVSGYSNRFAVLGNGSTWTNVAQFRIGGGSNLLEILDGGRLLTDSFDSTAISNHVVVGTGSELTVARDFGVYGSLDVEGTSPISSSRLLLRGGPNHQLRLLRNSRWDVKTNIFFSAANNRLLITEGSTIQSPMLTLGFATLATNNEIRIQGADSKLLISSLTSSSRWHRVFIEDGALLQSDTMTNMRGDLSITVAGPNSAWLHVGDVVTGLAWINDSFRVFNGALATNSQATIGALENITSTAGMPTHSSLLVDGAGSRWFTAKDLVIGLRADSNRVTIVNGGEVRVGSNLFIGKFEWPTRPSGISRPGAQNDLAIDGAGSRLTVENMISLGHRTSSNRFLISNGGVVNAKSFRAGEIDVQQDLTFITRSNIVEIAGAGSHLNLSSTFSGNGADHITITAGGKLTANGAAFGRNNLIRGPDSRVELGAFASFAGNQLVIESGGQLYAEEVRLGYWNIGGNITVAGDGSIIRTDRLYLYKVEGPGIPAPMEELRLRILDSAHVLTKELYMGLGEPSPTNHIIVDGGLLTVLTAPSDGLTEIDHGRIDLLSGTIILDRLIMRTNAEISVVGKILLGNLGPIIEGQLGIKNLTIDHRASLSGAELAFANDAQLNVLISSNSTQAPIVGSIASAIAGNLTVRLTPGHTLQPGQSVTLLTSPTITGQFQNAPLGSRINVADDAGSFLLSAQNGGLILSDFQPPTSGLRVTATFNRAASELTLSFPEGAATKIETSTDLIQWTEIQSPQFETVNGQTTWKTPVDPSQPQRYFRLVE